jgi:omega-6 fatty acid desaturase (delta-12 desaturase)
VPRTWEDYCDEFRIPTETLYEIVQDAPLYEAYFIATRLLFGWPAYLVTNATGYGSGETRRQNPVKSYMFEMKNRKLILLSDAGSSACCALLHMG